MEKTLSFEDKYDIIFNKKPGFDGIFYTAVKTTGIFCRPTCTARKPKIENVEFFNTSQDCIVHGYRPCKVCKPIELPGQTPAYIQDLIDELNGHPYRKIKDYDLRNRGVEPNKLRRWFKVNHGVTFHGYQRMLRINSAFHKISRGESVTDTAFDSGFESISGFNSSYQKIFGDSASQSTKKVINILRLTTPIGPMFACATDHGICLLEFTSRRMLETEFKDLMHKLDAVILPGTNKHLDHLMEELKEYFEGHRKSFDVSLHTPGTPFQQSVWNILGKIPYGKTWSYQEQAIRLENPNAVRAVASANGYNRVAIIIPCHRVIGKDGSLTGYGGGLEKKKWLLDFEKNNS